MVAVPTIRKNEYKQPKAEKDSKDEKAKGKSPSKRTSAPKGVGGSYVSKDGVRTKVS